jgi:hypothetical protein
LLTTTESEKVAYATRPFFMAFGYGTNRSEHPELPPASECIAEPSMEGWIDHFVPPDLVSGWARLLGSSRRLELHAHHEGQVVGRTLADLRRADLTGFGDSDVGFQLRLSMPVTLGELTNRLCRNLCNRQWLRVRPHQADGGTDSAYTTYSPLGSRRALNRQEHRRPEAANH